MTLGDLLGRFGDPAAAEAAIVAIGDVALLAEVAAERGRQGETAGEYASGAVSRFANLAGDEDWLALMTAIDNADDPATACLGAMLRWSVRRDRTERIADDRRRHHSEHACGCGGNGACGDE